MINEEQSVTDTDKGTILENLSRIERSTKSASSMPWSPAAGHGDLPPVTAITMSGSSISIRWIGISLFVTNGMLSKFLSPTIWTLAVGISAKPLACSSNQILHFWNGSAHQ
jgi:hypothetical protein